MAAAVAEEGLKRGWMLILQPHFNIDHISTAYTGAGRQNGMVILGG